MKRAHSRYPTSGSVTNTSNISNSQNTSNASGGVSNIQVPSNTPTSSNISTSNGNSVQQNTANIKETIFKYSAYPYKVYFGSTIKIEDLVYKSAYNNFLDSIVCFNIEMTHNVEIEGGTVVNPQPGLRGKCFTKPETIFIPDDPTYTADQMDISTYKFNDAQNEYNYTDGISLIIRKDPANSDTEKDEEVLILTRNSYRDMINACKDLDVDALKTIKNLLTASTITSGISTVGGIANTVMGGISIANNKSEEDKSQANKKLDVASTIVSSVGTVTFGASTATSAVAISKVNDIIDDVKKCKNAINNLIFKVD